MERKLKFTVCREYFFICSGSFVFASLIFFLLKFDDMLLRELPNKYLILINLACASLFGLFFYLLEKRHSQNIRQCILFPAALYAGLFIIQIVLVNQTYFYTGWDVGTMQNTVTVLWNGGSMQEPYHLCIYASCFCVAVSCFLGNLILRKLSLSRSIHIFIALKGFQQKYGRRKS